MVLRMNKNIRSTFQTSALQNFWDLLLSAKLTHKFIKAKGSPKYLGYQSSPRADKPICFALNKSFINVVYDI